MIALIKAMAALGALLLALLVLLVGAPALINYGGLSGLLASPFVVLIALWALAVFFRRLTRRKTFTHNNKATP